MDSVITTKQGTFRLHAMKHYSYYEAVQIKKDLGTRNIFAIIKKHPETARRWFVYREIPNN